MSLALIFRNKATPNLFRNAVLAAVNIPYATEILICSGFFQNNFHSTYCASREGGLAKNLKASGASVITVGVHNYNWDNSFSDFNQDLLQSGVNVSSRLVKSRRWHAKVFIVSTKKGPVFAAIGSSNMTRNAFSISTPFNYEADVLLWVPQATDVSRIVKETISSAEPTEIIKAVYSTSKNSGMTVKTRLTKLRQQIIESSE